MLREHNRVKMSFPNPKEAPNEFGDHLKSSNLDFAVTTFSHYRTQPVKTPNVRYDASSATEWCDRMDALLVSQYPCYSPKNY